MLKRHRHDEAWPGDQRLAALAQLLGNQPFLIHVVAHGIALRFADDRALPRSARFATGATPLVATVATPHAAPFATLPAARTGVVNALNNPITHRPSILVDEPSFVTDGIVLQSITCREGNCDGRTATAQRINCVPPLRGVAARAKAAPCHARQSAR